MAEFNPHDVGVVNGNMFGFPDNPETADVILIPVPWEVTVSFRTGTSNGPQAVLEASVQLDFFDEHIENAWETGISMLPIPQQLHERSKELREVAVKAIDAQEHGTPQSELIEYLTPVNRAGHALCRDLHSLALKWLKAGKVVGVLGGDHSTPLGLMMATAEAVGDFGLLHIDAHADMREAYLGFEHSHASIMHNAHKLPQLEKHCLVGIRDFSAEEYARIEQSPIAQAWTNRSIQERMFKGETWHTIVHEIVESLPQHVYVSFDIDGLLPELCPGTGTPVPGGLQFDQAVYLVSQVVASGRSIVAFDLVEVSNRSEWDAIVGAHLLYKLCIHAAKSNKS